MPPDGHPCSGGYAPRARASSSRRRASSCRRRSRQRELGLQRRGGMGNSPQPSTSAWNPSAWATWPFITISGISGAPIRNFLSTYLKNILRQHPYLIHTYNIYLRPIPFPSYEHHLPVGFPVHPLRRHHPLRGRGLPVQQSQGFHIAKM